MTPSMHLGGIIASFSGHPDAEAITAALHRAFSLGHEFGIERAADTVKWQANCAARIRALVVAEVQPVSTIEESFL